MIGSWKGSDGARIVNITEGSLRLRSSFESIAHILYVCNKEIYSSSNLLRVNAYMHKTGIDVYAITLQNHLLCIHDKVDGIHLGVHRFIFDNEGSSSALIFEYIKSGKLELAYAMYEKLYKDNPMEPTTLALLNACAKFKEIGIGSHLHRIVDRAGLLKTSHFVGSALVDMYTKCGSISKAQGVFDELPIRDVVSWTTLIGGYAEHSLGKEALCCFDQMQLEGVLPDHVTFLCILKACVVLGSIHKGIEIHGDLERQGVLEKNLVLRSALMDMYLKYGLLTKAQEMFDKFPSKDVVTWNALISGYVKCGCGEKALKCFEKMQGQGVSPNIVTFVSVLKACGSTRNARKGVEMHGEIHRYRLLETNIFVGSVLVEMYAKCGLLPNARDVFDNLPIRNVVTWTTIIGGHVEHGYGKEALNLFEEMKVERISPNAITYVYSLKACGIIGSLEKGCELHAEIESQSLLKSNLFIGSSLLDMYVKCGSLAKAHKVFDGILIKDIVLWNALIGGYAEHGHGKEALKCLEQMQAMGVSPNAVTLLCSLKACGSVGDIDKGKGLHDEIRRQSLLETNNLFGSALVDMYAKCGMLGKAKEIFDKIPVQDVVPWNALIAGYTDHGFHEDAFRCFKEMQRKGVCPDAITLICCLKACGSIGAPENVQELYDEIVRQGLVRDPIVSNALVDTYIKCGLFDMAGKVFAKLKIQDVVSWTMLIAGYTEQGYNKEALELFELMQHEGVSPNAITLACSLKACGHIGARDKVKEIHTEIKKQALLEKDPVVGNTLVDMYAKHGFLSAAQEVFDILPSRDIAAWTALISGYVQAGHGKEALKCFEQMQFEGVFADALTYICGLKACGMMGAIDKGEEMHAEIERHGFLADDLIVGNTLVDMYAKCGALGKAQQVFGKLHVRNVVSWTTLMAGYVHHGESENVFQIFEMMLEEGIRPDPISFVVVLSACSRQGLFQKTQTYFESMSKMYGIVPAIEHHTCMIDLLSRMGRLGEAFAMVQKIPLNNDKDTTIWQPVLSACAMVGNLEFGKLAFEHVFK